MCAGVAAEPEVNGLMRAVISKVATTGVACVYQYVDTARPDADTNTADAISPSPPNNMAAVPTTDVVRDGDGDGSGDGATETSDTDRHTVTATATAATAGVLTESSTRLLVPCDSSDPLAVLAEALRVALTRPVLADLLTYGYVGLRVTRDFPFTRVVHKDEYKLVFCPYARRAGGSDAFVYDDGDGVTSDGDGDGDDDDDNNNNDDASLRARGSGSRGRGDDSASDSDDDDDVGDGRYVAVPAQAHQSGYTTQYATDRPDPRIYVYVKNPPTPDGNLTSALASLTPDLFAIRSMRNAALVAGQLACMPLAAQVSSEDRRAATLAMQTNDQFQHRHQASRVMYQAATSRELLTQFSMMAYSDAPRTALNAPMRPGAAYNTLYGGINPKLYVAQLRRDDIEPVPANIATVSLLPLPPGTDIKPMAMPTLQYDHWMQARQAFYERAAMQLEVPAQVFNPTGSTFQYMAANVEERFYNAIDQHLGIMEQILQVALLLVLRRALRVQSRRSTSSNTRRRSAATLPLSLQTLPVYTREQMANIVLSLGKTTRPTLTMQLINEGYVQEQYVPEVLARVCGLDPQMLQAPSRQPAVFGASATDNQQQPRSRDRQQSPQRNSTQHRSHKQSPSRSRSRSPSPSMTPAADER